MLATMTPAILAAIAQALGPDWQATNTDSTPFILAYCGPDPDLCHAEIYCIAERYSLKAGRVAWHAYAHAREQLHSQASIFLKDILPYNEREKISFEITLTASKTPAQQARELQRRLLSWYLPLYRRGIVRLREAEAQRAADNALATALHAAAYPGDAPRRGTLQLRDSNRSDAAQVWLPNAVRLSVCFSKVTVERLSGLTDTQALQLMELLARWCTERTDNA